MTTHRQYIILIVDDDPQIRKLLNVTLRRSGYATLEAADGHQALRRFRQTPVDLVITDLIMPKKEGIETILEMRKERPAMPIIAISGGGQLDPRTYLDIAEKIGVVETMVKPIDIARLVARVAAHLAGGPIPHQNCSQSQNKA
ncbi:Response regulator receiver protein (modular protein) [Desulfosarcina cetonica]|uniref:response regulator n=1 Tax=Desulfosarcina cetonica TaxID=90730 RepID=UPI0006D146AE|nr:response regulator [Desulfosarcina cetonica]VTR66510.1 Response regulator receiver protein (modular protein) [Desulfosarcina cetonica]